MTQLETETPRPVAAGLAARRVMRRCDRAALATMHRLTSYWPFPALVLVAFDYDGTPLLFISGLAEHTQNLQVEPRAGLLFDGTGAAGPVLAGPRVTVVGQVERSQAPHHRARFLARHPEAAEYAGFADFALYRLVVEGAHLVAGFGRIRWLDPSALLVPAGLTAGFAAAEAALVTGSPGDSQPAAAIGAGRLAGAGDRLGDWTLTGIDPDGFDGRLAGSAVRTDFPQPVAAAAVESALGGGAG